MPSSCYEFGNLQGAELISRIVSVAVDRVGQSRLDHQRVCDVVYCFEFYCLVHEVIDLERPAEFLEGALGQIDDEFGVGRGAYRHVAVLDVETNGLRGRSQEGGLKVALVLPDGFECSFDGKLFVEEVGGGHIAENFLIFDIGVQRELQTAKGYSGAAAARNGGIGAREFRGEILGDEAVFGSG